jgi:hypothetical protein
MDGYDMKKVKLNSNPLKREMLDIKKRLILRNQIITPDDSNYTFAFIADKDTLFSDRRLEFWRYKDKGMALEISGTPKKIILEHYKLKASQQ